MEISDAHELQPDERRDQGDGGDGQVDGRDGIDVSNMQGEGKVTNPILSRTWSKRTLF